MNFPEEIIEEFLIRLPLKPMIKFKSVSKDWNNLISRVGFRNRYQSRHKNTCPGGFVYHLMHRRETDISPDFSNYMIVEPAIFVWTSNIDKSEVVPGQYLQEFGTVIGSSKGLLLFSRNYNEELFVYDLLTKAHVHIPPKDFKTFMAIGFICKEREENCPNYTNSNSSYITYKIVCIATICRPPVKNNTTTYKVETYSSETRNWLKSTMTSASEFSLGPQQTATVIDATLYWWDITFKIFTAYDPEDPTGRARLIEFPESHKEIDMLHLSSTEEGHLLCMTTYTFGYIDLWILGKEQKNGCYLDKDYINHNQWTLLHRFHHMELAAGLFGCMDLQEGMFSNAGPINYRPAGIHREDSSIIYLKMADEFVSYSLKEKRIKSILSKRQESRSYDSEFVRAYIRFDWPSWPCLQ